MPKIELQSVAMYYELDGPPAAPVLILSNSLGSGLNLWDRQVSRLSERFRVLRYDTRGHGRSSTPAGPYTLEDLGQDVLQLMDALQIEKAHFCGISLGGITALWLALHAPGRCLGIVAANTSARIGTVEGWSDRIHTVQEQGMSALVEGALARWFTDSFRQSHPETSAAVGEMLRKTDPAGYILCCGALRSADLRDRVRAIAIPTLIVAGAQDTVTVPEDGRSLAQHIAHSQYVELDAAHLSNVERSEEFTQAVLDFLTGDIPGR